MATRLRFLLVLVLFACGVLAASAQSTTGSIWGTISDESKGVLPGVTVLVVNVETGAERTLVTDESGRYRALNLSPATYRVRAELPGFSPAEADSILLQIGREVPVNLTLSVGKVEEQVEVQGKATLVDLGSAVVGGVVSTRQIAELPLNGRSFMQLATLQPGVSVSRNSSTDFTGGFGGTQISIAGARPEQTGYLLEGTNVSDISDKAPSSVAGVMLGVDTVQEFSVQTHGYNAEFGRAAGGIISAVTKSGTNSFKGTVFEFLRNSAFDEMSYFDQTKPPFHRNQFGGTLGGPIVKNKLFFFGSYEGLRERLGRTLVGRVPDANAKNGYLPDGKGGLRFVGVNPIIKPYLDLLWPLPNDRSFGDGTAQLVSQQTFPTNENMFVGKIDYNMNEKNSFLVRVSSDKGEAQTWNQNPLISEIITTNTRFTTGQWQRLFSSNTLNQIRFAINRTERQTVPTPLIDIPKELYFVNEPDFGYIEMPSISLMLGGNGGDRAHYVQNLYQVADTLTLNRGRSTWKTGFDMNRYNFYGVSNSRLGGAFRFRTLEEMLTLKRSSSAQADRFTGALPGTDTYRDTTQNYVSMFVHDDFRWSDRVTLSLGLRYEFVTVPVEKDGKIAGLLSLNDLESGPKGATPGSPLFDNPSKSHGLAPRLGFAWTPRGDTKTTVRGGAGIFYQPLTVSFYRGTTFRIFPFYTGIDMKQPAKFGPAIQQVIAAGVSDAVQKRSEFIYYDANQPYNTQWYLNSQHELAGGFVAEVGYMGSRGVNLPAYGDPNTTPSEYTADGTKQIVPGAKLRFPSWGRIRTRKTDAWSRYNGVTLGLQKRYSQGLQFQGNYTFAHSNDTWSGGLQGSSDFQTGPGTVVDFYDPNFEAGPSNFDVRHNFMFNAVYSLPIGKDATGLKGALVRGWQVSGILNITSGSPFHPVIGFDRAGDGQSDTDMQRPSWAPGFDSSNTVIGNPDQWFNSQAFVLPAAGTFGNVQRNSLLGPNLRVVDASLFKMQQIGKVVVQFRFEVFNLFNRTNFATPSSLTLFDSTTGAYVPGAGQITRVVTPARQMQLGLKFVF